MHDTYDALKVLDQYLPPPIVDVNRKKRENQIITSRKVVYLVDKRFHDRVEQKYIDEKNPNPNPNPNPNRNERGTLVI